MLNYNYGKWDYLEHLQYSSESCPPTNIKSREIFVEIKDKLEKNMSNNDVIRIKSFYMSVLKNKWLIISEGQNPFDIKNRLIDAGVGNFNSVKIVPLKKYDDVLNKIKQ